MSSTDIVEKYVETTQLDQSLQVALPRQRRGYVLVKRVFDVFFSLIALVVLFPVMLLIALAIVIDDPKAGPFFIQRRRGKDNKELHEDKLTTIYSVIVAA